MYDKYIDEDVKVYAACTEVEEEKWRDFIKKYEFIWLDVADFELISPFRELYDIRSTPRIFLLDKNKKIIAKKLGVAQLDKFLERLLKNDKKKEDSKKG